MSKKLKAGNLHYPNDETKTAVQPEVDLENHQSSMQLQDPEDKEGAGRLHFPNGDTNGPGEETPVKEAVSAAARIAKVMKSKASTEQPGAEGPAAAEDATGAGTNVGTLGNGTDAPAPTDGYLEVKEGTAQPAVASADEGCDEDEGFDDEDEDEGDEAEIAASFSAHASADDGLEIPNAGAAQQQIEIGADVDEDWDPAPEGEEDEDLEIVDDEEPEVEVDEPVEASDEFGADEFGDDDFAEPANIEAGDADVMDLLDVDGTEDNGDDMAFATVGNVVHALKANRIVASIGKKHAAKANVSDVYLTDEFTEVVEAEVKRHGLRAGLKSMGFALARVNVTASKVVNKRVEAKVKKLNASVRAEQAQYDQTLEQSLAIASVGIQRQYFKDAKNPLKAALVEQLESAGVRGANRLVAAVFAKHGVPYTKEVLGLAKRLSAMSQDARNAFASALDMTSEEVADDEGLDEEIIASEDEGIDNEFDDEFVEDIEAPSSIEAALGRPIHRKQVSASVATRSQDMGALLTASPRQQTKLSAAARAVLLDGDLYAGS